MPYQTIKKMKKYIIYSVFVFIAACSPKAENTAKDTNNTNGNTVTLTAAQIKNGNITLGKAEPKNLVETLTLNGVIDVPPQNMVSVSVPMGGYLKSTKLLPGMRVAKGDVIAVVEDQQYIQLQQDYLNAQINLTYKEAEYFRQKDLNTSKASSDKVFQQAEADYKSQKILLKSLYEKLKLVGINPDKLSDSNLSRSISIYSPIDGFVARVNVNTGKYVTPADVLFELVNPADIHLNLTVFEKDISKLSIGQTVYAYTNNNPTKKYACKIILIGQSLSAGRTVEVHCHFDEYDKLLLPGMYMNAIIEINSNNGLALPTDAVVQFENKHYVFVSKGNNVFETLEVVPAASDKGFTQIQPKDQTLDISTYTFATKGAYALLMALKNQAE